MTFTALDIRDTSKNLLFRAIRELAINVVKHAQAKHLKVSVDQGDTQLQIVVHDDGIGFDSANFEPITTKEGGYGLFSIKERITYMGGTVDIQSRPDQGTSVVIQLPCPRC